MKKHRRMKLNKNLLLPLCIMLIGVFVLFLLYLIFGRTISLFLDPSKQISDPTVILKCKINYLCLSVLCLIPALPVFCFLCRAFTVTAVAQTCILGLMWVFGAFLFKNYIVVAYFFTILNSLQGALIFVMHCLLCKQVQI